MKGKGLKKVVLGAENKYLVLSFEQKTQYYKIVNNHNTPIFIDSLRPTHS